MQKIPAVELHIIDLGLFFGGGGDGLLGVWNFETQGKILS